MEATTIDQEFILQTLAAHKEQLRLEFGIAQIGLYGSFARNEQTAKSDIDLVYTVEEGHSLGLVERDRLHRILRRKLGRKLDLVNSKVMNPFVSYYMRKDIIYVW